jgi:hypothetical protein
MDWKYALGLELADPGFDFSVVSQFRDRLGVDKRAMMLLETMLARAGQAGLLRARGRVRTDSTHVLARIRTLNRLEKVGEGLRLALEEIARVAPGWLMSRIPAGTTAGRPARKDDSATPGPDASTPAATAPRSASTPRTADPARYGRTARNPPSRAARS